MLPSAAAALCPVAIKNALIMAIAAAPREWWAAQAQTNEAVPLVDRQLQSRPPSATLMGAQYPTAAPLIHFQVQAEATTNKVSLFSISRINSVFIGSDDTHPGDEESLPQIHEGHYFNVLNLFKIGGARYEYRVARKQSQMSNHSQGKMVTGVPP